MVLFARHPFASTSAGGIELAYGARPVSVVVAAVATLVASLAIVVFSAIGVSSQDVASALRAQPAEGFRSIPMRARWLLSGAALVVFVAAIRLISLTAVADHGLDGVGLGIVGLAAN